MFKQCVFLMFFALSLASGQLLFPKIKPITPPLPINYQIKQILLTGIMMTMTWKSTNVSNQFEYFDSLTGQGIYQLGFSFKLEPNSIMAHVNIAIFYLLDPKYIDKKLAVIQVPINGSFNKLTENWEGSSTSVVQLLDNLKVIGTSHQIPNTTFVINQTHAYLNSSFFSFSTLVHPRKYQPLLPWILLLPTILMLVSMHYVTLADIPSIQISLITLFININFLLCVSLQQLYYGVMAINNPQGWLIFTGVITFSTVIRFVQCFQSVIRRINGIKGYLQFYIFTFVYLWCLFSYAMTSWFTIVNSLFLVPQIIHNIYEGIKPKFYFSYISTIISSQLYMLYIKGCPQNILGISPNYYACLGIIISLTLQIIILYLQYQYGARFFIPKKWIPGYYEYIDPLVFEDCTICLLPLCQQPGDNFDFESEKKQQKQYVQAKITKKIMKTPCNHRFHIKCLQTWMDQKMQCPVDRMKLPSIQ